MKKMGIDRIGTRHRVLKMQEKAKIVTSKENLVTSLKSVWGIGPEVKEGRWQARDGKLSNIVELEIKVKK